MCKVGHSVAGRAPAMVGSKRRKQRTTLDIVKSRQKREGISATPENKGGYVLDMHTNTEEHIHIGMKVGSYGELSNLLASQETGVRDLFNIR